MSAIAFGKGVLKVATHPATITVVAGGIGLATAYIGYRASKYNAEASKNQFDSVILQAKMGGFDQQVADEFLAEMVKEAVKNEFKEFNKYRKEKKEEKKEENKEDKKEDDCIIQMQEKLKAQLKDRESKKI